MNLTFVEYNSPEEYKVHYEKNYCSRPVLTFDGIRVFFSKDRFSHAFYESSDWQGSKDVFSEDRAKRIDWIKETLESKEAQMFQGWDAINRCYFPDGRVSVVYENFVVIIKISLTRNGDLKGNFVTCYQADNSIGKIKASPVWDRDKCMEKLQK